ncbi:hypothetical protein [Sphingomonas xinjiangensis]|uniref:Uncharacterized protein n=1 Tax=Sphingomonas xinjiangensis TaxID=643568 RepID=A0A840YTR1_9SPHN|nr:hypothetical protein [Sphingomonas xinjiangensis]MBB5713032.1 hypothetical protein [Sphingomonas xinjiangensis]
MAMADLRHHGEIIPIKIGGDDFADARDCKASGKRGADEKGGFTSSEELNLPQQLTNVRVAQRVRQRPYFSATSCDRIGDPVLLAGKLPAASIQTFGELIDPVSKAGLALDSRARNPVLDSASKARSGLGCARTSAESILGTHYRWLRSGADKARARWGEVLHLLAFTVDLYIAHDVYSCTTRIDSG